MPKYLGKQNVSLLHIPEDVERERDREKEERKFCENNDQLRFHGSRLDQNWLLN